MFAQQICGTKAMVDILVVYIYRIWAFSFFSIKIVQQGWNSYCCNVYMSLIPAKLISKIGICIHSLEYSFDHSAENFGFFPFLVGD